MDITSDLPDKQTVSESPSAPRKSAIKIECDDETGQKPQQHEVTLGVHVAWYTTSISKGNRNCLGAARLLCMTEVSDLPDPVAGCRRLPGIRMLRRNDLVWASGNSRSALDQRTYT